MVRQSIVLLLGLSLIFSTVSAQQSETTERLEREIARYQQQLANQRRELSEIETELGATAEVLSARIAERDRISEELGALQRERTSLQDELAQLEQELEQTEARIAELEVRLSELDARLQAMLLNLHRQRSSRYSRLLAETDTLFELRVKNHYLSLLTEQDVSLLQELEAVVAELDSAQRQLTEQVRERNTRIEALRVNEEQLAATRSELNAVIAELESTREGQLAQRQSLIGSQSRLEQTIAGARRSLQEEITRLERRAEEERRRAQAAAAARERQRHLEQAEQAEAELERIRPPVELRESDFVLPLSSPQLLSAYGQEGAYVTFRAPQEGAAVRSVMSGVVWLVYSLGANHGYLVAVQHGPELITAYVNLQPPSLSEGDRIAQGEVLGYLGGGTLIPADVLRFYVGVPRGNGSPAWIDPASRLNF